MKNIEWQDDRDIYGRMLLLTDSFIFTGLRNAVDNYDADLTDALTWGQLKSKRWLITKLEELNIDPTLKWDKAEISEINENFIILKSKKNKNIRINKSKLNWALKRSSFIKYTNSIFLTSNNKAFTIKKGFTTFVTMV